MERNLSPDVCPQIGSRPIRGLASVSLLFLLVALGCSASNSSETLSDSVSSPFKWSSRSSDSSSDGDSAYRQDVSDYTVAFAHAGSAASGADLDAFRSGLRQLAELRGISNWEEDGPTCASIGLGLRDAGLDDATALAFAQELLGDNTGALAALRAGYATPQLP